MRAVFAVGFWLVPGLLLAQSGWPMWAGGAAGTASAASSGRAPEFIVATFTVPRVGDDATQSFVWHRPPSLPRLEVGAAYIWRTGDVRLLGNYDLAPETDTSPFVNLGFAFQDSFEEDVAPFLTTGKRFTLGATRLNAYAGLIDRPNERHLHLISGVRLALEEQLFMGFQHTGHEVNYYVGVTSGPVSISLWARDGTAPGVLASFTVRR